MAIDAKRIQVCVLRIAKFSFNICSKFVIKHPLISCVFLFLLIFYFFLPKAFFLLIYSCPFLSCTYVFIKLYRKNGGKRSDSGSGRVKIVKKDGKSVRRTHTRSSSSRNMEVRSREAVTEERKSRIADDDDGGAVTTAAEEKIGSLIASACEKIGELKSDLKSKSDFVGKVETEISTSEDEEAKESRNKAVEWNEDDQKNLMDLGLSELERNKRLESLIARRRARKLYKAQTDKNLMSSINSSNSFLVAPVSIARSNTFDVQHAPDLLIPGSAPSILLERNPFDLPYDPFEEKPNLMADSFQQEFMEAQQKEMSFCRHESFALGPFYQFPTTHNDINVAGQSGLKRCQDERDSDRRVQPLQFEDGGTLHHSLSATDLVTENVENSVLQSQPEELEEAISSTIENKGKPIENSEMESSIDERNEAQIVMEAMNESSSSLPQNEQHARAKNATNLTHLATPVFRFPESSIQSSGPCPLPKARTANEMNYLASPATIDRSTLENHLLYTNSGPWHTPNDSIASDMQVEVSEVGSPPLTGDGSASSNDGDSLTYDGDAEKEITSGSDEMWGVSPRASGGEEQDLTSREVNELGNIHISSDFLVRQNEPEGSVIHSVDSDRNIASVGEQVVEQWPSSELQDSVDSSQNLQESMNVSEKSEDELNINDNLDVLAPAYSEVEDEKPVDVTRDLPETSTTAENDHDINSSREKSVEEVTIGYITDTLAPTFDDTDTENKKSVRVIYDLPETSTISEIDREAASDMIFGSSNHVESEPLSSEQSVEEVCISYSTDVPAPACDDLEDLKSVEVSVPETSISEVLHDLSEPVDKINSESSHHSEQVAETIDAPVQTYDDGLGDQKSVEVASYIPETSIISEIARDLSAMADEIHSGVSNHTESESLDSLEKAIDEVSVAETIDAPVQTHDGDSGDQKSVELARDLPETSIISEIARDLTVADEINSGVSNHTESESLNTPEKAIEEVSITDTIDAPVSTSDDLGEQKSVEIGNVVRHTQATADREIPAIEAEKSTIEDENSNEGKESSIPSEDVEDKHSMSEVGISGISQNPNDSSTSGSAVEQVSPSQKSVSPTSSGLNTHTQTSDLTPAQNEQHERPVDSGNHPSIEGSSQNTEGSPDLGKTIDNAREMLHTNEALMDDEKAKEDPKSRESIHDKAEKPTGDEVPMELSNLPDETESRLVEHIEDTSGNQSKNDPSIQPTKQDEEQGRLENLTEHRDSVSPSKPAVDGDHIVMSATAGDKILLQNATIIDETVSDKISGKDQFGVISENEGESQGVDKSSDTTEIPKFTENQDESFKSSTDTKSESRNVTDAALTANKLDQSEGSNNSNDIKNVENPAKDASESEQTTQNGIVSDNVTVIDEVKTPASEAPQD